MVPLAWKLLACDCSGFFLCFRLYFLPEAVWLSEQGWDFSVCRWAHGWYMGW
jgi:hypothetical protein